MDGTPIAQAQPEAPPASAPAPSAAPAAEAPAATTGTQQPTPTRRVDETGQMLSTFLMFGAIFVVFWFVLIRPQRKREQERLAKLERLQRNDRVMTSGGILGTVHAVKDNVIVIKVDEDKDVKIQVTKGSVVPLEPDPAAGKKTA